MHTESHEINHNKPMSEWLLSPGWPQMLGYGRMLQGDVFANLWLGMTLLDMWESLKTLNLKAWGVFGFLSLISRLWERSWKAKNIWISEEISRKHMWSTIWANLAPVQSFNFRGFGKNAGPGPRRHLLHNIFAANKGIDAIRQASVKNPEVR